MEGGKKRFDVLTMRDYETKDGEKKTVWRRIGTAFENRDGSFNVELEAVPVSGRMQLREPREDDRAGVAGVAERGKQLKLRNGATANPAEVPF